MSEWPDAARLRAFLAGATRRRALVTALEWAALGFISAQIVTLAIAAVFARELAVRQLLLLYGGLSGVGVIAGAIGALLVRPPIAPIVERRATNCRNIIITAAELLVQPARVPFHIGAAVCSEASRLSGGLDVNRLFPARRAAVAWVGSMALALAVLAGLLMRPGSSSGAVAGGTEVWQPAVTNVEVTVSPPAYAGQDVQTLRNPGRIAALAGSRLQLRVRAAAATLALETLAGRQLLQPQGDGTFRTELAADADGFIALEPLAASGRAGVRRLIGLSVTPDRAPRLRITTPGRDLILPDARRTVAVSIDADDDMGLAALRLRFTRVSGSGEQFTFTEGELPLQVTRVDARNWRASASIPLQSLAPAAGDMLVYRAVATDQRPGAAPAESDAWIIEISAPGAIASEGFAINDEDDRYALSQQMLILKTERLRARASAMPADSVSLESLSLAAEQRAIRAEFVFMMGGELAEEVLAAANMDDLNEEAHAEADDEAIAGRLANQGRLSLLQAIRSMSRANSALTATDLTRALTEERAALNYLERAFSRTRYILRALTQRERLDLSRRLTGMLDAAGRAVRPIADPQLDAHTARLRRTLAELATLSAGITDADAAVRLGRLAQAVLQVDAAAQPMQQISRQLQEAAQALTDGRGEGARTLVDSATVDLARLVRAGLLASPSAQRPAELKRLEGALVDALRTRGRS
jgi:hypothetical protein